MRISLIVLFALFFWAPAQAKDLTVVTFNTESDADTSPTLVASQIKALGELDILAVQEVESEKALFDYTKALAEEHGGRWRYVISVSGTNTSREDDLLGIIYNSDEFRELATTEFHMVRSKDGGGAYGDTFWSLRGVLLVRLLDYQTEKEFQIATMHLKCCNEPAIRLHQTKVLAAELRSATRPTILLGDSNLPLNPDGSPMSAPNEDTFLNLTRFSGLAWAKPENPMPTQCSTQFRSMLDQVYVPEAVAAATTARILFPESDYCDGDANGFADHRPVRATIVNFLDQQRMAAPEAAAAPAETDDIDMIEERAQRLDRPGDVMRE